MSWDEFFWELRSAALDVEMVVVFVAGFVPVLALLWFEHGQTFVLVVLRR